MQETYTLHWHPLSPFSRTVRTFLLLNKITFKSRNVKIGQSEHRTPEFRALNPNSLVPVLEVHREGQKSFTIWESKAILFYLANRFDNELLPTKPR